jgi:hypothetical protein
MYSSAKRTFNIKYLLNTQRASVQGSSSGAQRKTKYTVKMLPLRVLTHQTNYELLTTRKYCNLHLYWFFDN